MERSPGFQPGDKPPEAILSDQPERPPSATPPELFIDESNDATPPKNRLDTISFKPVGSAPRTTNIDDTKSMQARGTSGPNVVITSPKAATGKISFNADQDLPVVPESADDDKVDTTAYYHYVDNLRKIRNELIAGGLITPIIGRDFVNALIDKRAHMIDHMILDLEKIDNQLVFSKMETEKLSDRRIELVCELNGMISAIPPTLNSITMSAKNIIVAPAGSILIPPAGENPKVINESFVEIGRAHV